MGNQPAGAVKAIAAIFIATLTHQALIWCASWKILHGEQNPWSLEQ